MPELLRGGVIDASELKNALKALSGGSRRDESALLVPEDIFAVQSIICEWHNRAYRHLVEIVNFRTWVGAGCFVFGNFIPALFEMEVSLLKVDNLLDTASGGEHESDYSKCLRDGRC